MGFYSKAVQAAKPEDANKPFGMKDKLAYAAGDLGCNMSFALNSYLMLFWTQYMGISMVIWGFIILGLKIWDAVNDPIIGGLVDRIKPRPGQSKFKPWIFWGSFVLVFAGALCFIPVKEAPLIVKIIICVVGYLLWDMSYTIVNVPYGSLNSVIAPDNEARSSLSTWRSIGSFAGNIILAILIPMFIYDKQNNLVGNVLIIVGAVAGVVGLICFQFLCRGTTERVIVDYEQQKKENKFNYFQSLGKFFTNKAAVSYTLSSIFFLLCMAFMQNLSALYIQTTWEGLSQYSGIVSMLGMLPMVFFIPFATKLAKKYGKKEASAWPMVLGIIAGLLLIFIPIETFKSPTIGLVVWLIPNLLMGLGTSVNSLVGWAMVADCIDYQEIKTGVREEGVVYATYSLGRKLAQGFGASLVAFLLILTGYQESLGAHQAVGVNGNIRVLLGVVFLVCFVAQFVLLMFVYNLDKKKVQEMEQVLGRSNANLIGENQED